jgi:Na+/H+-dicarboxylate symporter
MLGVDHYLYIARSATDVLGNGIATAMTSKAEGELKRHNMAKREPPARNHPSNLENKTESKVRFFLS